MKGPAQTQQNGKKSRLTEDQEGLPTLCSYSYGIGTLKLNGVTY